MLSNNLTYNLSGHGPIEIRVFPYAKFLYKLLESENYDAKFHYTNQLGALRDSFHGAHYTRYEYIILQWYLINQVQDSEALGLGFNSHRDNFGALDFVDNGSPPTLADIFQSISILNNMGHFPDTFAASKVWLNLLKKNLKDVRTGFRKGLNPQHKRLLDEMLEDFDYYHIHLLNGIFLLRRYTRPNKNGPFVNFANKILVDYINRQESDMQQDWDKYLLIRKLAYLLLDSTYAPIPFKLELGSIVSDLKQLFGGAQSQNVPLKNTVNEINALLENTLYLSPRSMITSTNRSVELRRRFDDYEANSSFKSIQAVEKLLEPRTERKNGIKKEEIHNIFNDHRTHSFPDLSWDFSKSFSLNYPEPDTYPSLFPQNLKDWERDLRQSCGKSLCMISAFKNPSSDVFKVGFAHKNTDKFKAKLNSWLKFVSKVMTFNFQLETNGYPKNEFREQREQNKRALISYTLESLSKWKKIFKLDYPNLENSREKPYFFGRGSKSMVSKVGKYMEEAKGKVEEYQFHEIKMLKKSR